MPLRSLAARNALVEQHLPLTRHIARRYARNADERQDYAQIGALALIDAATHYDPSVRCTFNTFAFRKITWALLALPRFRDAGSHAHRSKDAFERGGSPGQIFEWLEPTTVRFEQPLVDHIALEHAIEHLPARQRFVIEHQDIGRINPNLAPAMGISYQRVGQIKLDALAALRSDMSKQTVR